MAFGQSGRSRVERPGGSEATLLKPLISIVLPVRNAESTLGTALTSVLRQTHAHFECLVIDDGSHDNSAALAREVTRGDERFRVLTNDEPGLVRALNLGLERARGAWLARMDADDWMHRERLAMQLASLQAEPTWVGVGCHVRIFPRSALGPGRLEYEHWLNSMRTPEDVRRERFIECPLAHPSWFFRRKPLVQFAYREARGPEDYDLLLRLLGSGHRLGVVPHQLLFWRDHPTRLSRVDPRYDVRRFVELKAAHLASEFLVDNERYVLLGYGRTGKLLRRELGRVGYHPSHIVEIHPGRLGQVIAGARVVALTELEALRATPCVVSVAGLEARSEVRLRLRQMGKVEGRDFVCAA